MNFRDSRPGRVARRFNRLDGVMVALALLLFLVLTFIFAGLSVLSRLPY